MLNILPISKMQSKQTSGSNTWRLGCPMSFQNNSIQTEMFQFLQGHVIMCHMLPHLAGNNQDRRPSASQIIEKY